MKMFNIPLFNKKKDKLENILAEGILPETPNKVRHNIINKKDSVKIIDETLETISNSVAFSLGPHGANAAIGGYAGDFDISKDGYTILRSHKFDNIASRLVLDIVRDISRLQVSKVGDGTTTSILTASTLYKELIQYDASAKITSHRMMKVINGLKAELIKGIDGMSRPINGKEDIKMVASISANNDDEVGDLIANIYDELGESVLINATRSTGKETYFTSIKGYGVNYGLVHPIFINNVEKKQCELENPNILMVEGDLTSKDIEWLDKWVDVFIKMPASMGKELKPLVIIARNIDATVLEDYLVYFKKVNPSVPLLAIKLPTRTTNNRNLFYDLAIKIGAIPINKNDEDPKDGDMQDTKSEEAKIRFGTCDKIISGERDTVFVGGGGAQEDVDARLKSIQSDLDKYINRDDPENDYSAIEGQLRERMIKLNNKIATIYIGGDTVIEKRTKEFLIEDAVLATKAAVDHGVVPGCSLSVIKVLDNLIKDNAIDFSEFGVSDVDGSKLLEHVKSAFKSVYARLHMNMDGFLNEDKVENHINNFIDNGILFNLTTEKNEGPEEITVLTPSYSETVLIESVFSIIGLLLTTNQFIIQTPTRY